ncbi:MAG TPA: nucleotide sugar dehydrogenase [Mycobacteriales bacterium]|nr:nucleotide sugar dehydrogenase [Mycobacteriales bacterium]
MIVGQGYVGLPLAMRAVEVGHDVVGLDVDPGRVDQLAAAHSYVEDITDGSLAGALATGRYTPTTDYALAADFDVAVITVPTPLREGSPDLSFVESSTRELAAHVRPGATVILESTTYPGTTQEVVAPILEERSGLTAGLDFHLGYSPERIDPGNTKWTIVNTPKVVSGVTSSSLAAVQGFYDSVIERTVPVSSPMEAELTKLLENTFRHVNIALVNELALFAHELGIDVWEAIEAAATKPFGFMPFTPGPGVGGHCLPIDPSYLSWRVKRALGHNFRFVELANDVNEHMPEYVVSRLSAALNARRMPLNGSRILVLGAAYKRNTSDARESPSNRVLELLVAMGCEVRLCDPLVDAYPLRDRIEKVPAANYEEISAADAVLLLVDHDVYDFELIGAAARYVLDTRHRLVGATVEYL